MRFEEVGEKHKQLMEQGSIEVRDGASISTREDIQTDQAGWDDEDPSKARDFSQAEFWMRTDTGDVDAIHEDLSDRSQFTAYLKQEGLVDEEEQSSRQSHSADHFQVMQDLTDARQDRDKWRMEYQPPLSEAERKDWQERYNAMESKVDERQEAFADTLKSSTPEQLGSFRDLIAKRRQGMVESIEKEQGAAFVPAEASLADEQAQEQGGGFRDRLAQRRQEQQDESQGESSGGGRMTPRWSAYATTPQEFAEGKQLEEDQNMLAQRLGRRASDEEVKAYEAERAAKKPVEDSQQKPEKGQKRQDDYGLGM